MEWNTNYFSQEDMTHYQDKKAFFSPQGLMYMSVKISLVTESIKFLILGAGPGMALGYLFY